MLGGALQSCVLIDLLSEVVVRDAAPRSSPRRAELELHDRVRAILAAARPALVLAEDAVADERLCAESPTSRDGLRQPPPTRCST